MYKNRGGGGYLASKNSSIPAQNRGYTCKNRRICTHSFKDIKNKHFCFIQNTIIKNYYKISDINILYLFCDKVNINYYIAQNNFINKQNTFDNNYRLVGLC